MSTSVPVGIAPGWAKPSATGAPRLSTARTRSQACDLATGVLVGLTGAIAGIQIHRIGGLPPWEVLAVASLLLALVSRAGGRRARLGRSSVDLWFAAFIYVRAVLELYNEISLGRPGLFTTTAQPMFVCACYLAARLVVHDREGLRRFLVGLTVPVVPSVLLGLAQLTGVGGASSFVMNLTGSQALINRAERQALTRASGLIGQWTDFGSFACAEIAIVAILIYLARSERRRALYPVVVLAAALVGVVSTLTFAVIAAAIAIVLLSARTVRIRPKFVIGAVAALILSAPLLIPFVVNRVQQEYVATNQTLSRSSGLVPETLVFRFGVWAHQTIPAVVERPITGWGQGVYTQLRTWTDGPTSIVWPYPESEWFQQLMTGGVVELLVFCALLISAYRALARAPKQVAKPLRVLIGSMALVGITVPCFSDVGLPVPMWAAVGAVISAAPAMSSTRAATLEVARDQSRLRRTFR